MRAISITSTLVGLATTGWGVARLAAADGPGAPHVRTTDAVPTVATGPETVTTPTDTVAETVSTEPTTTATDTTPTTSTTTDTTTLSVDAAHATSTLSAQVTKSGARVTYDVSNAIDGSRSTAWCAPGDAAGESITLDLGGPAQVKGIRILPGYDKIDPDTGIDRFETNRRVTSLAVEVDGTEGFSDDLGGDLRLLFDLAFEEPVEGSEVRVDILATEGPADTCVSEIEVYGVATDGT